MLWKGFQRPKRIEVDGETLSPTYGKFIAQPFERGFATTVGNALRRSLLSSVEGAAITSVQIEGVLHEFSSMPGVVEFLIRIFPGPNLPRAWVWRVTRARQQKTSIGFLKIACAARGRS